MHIYSVLNGTLEPYWECGWPADRCSKLDMKYQIWCWELYKWYRESLGAPHLVLAKSTVGFYPGRLEEKEQGKNIAGWKQQRTDRQKWELLYSNKDVKKKKWELREALLGNDCDGVQWAGGEIRKGSEKPDRLSSSPAGFPHCAGCCEVPSHAKVSLQKPLAAFLGY